MSVDSLTVSLAFTEEQMDVWCLTVVRVDDLEVFDRGLCDSPVEVKDERLWLFIPAGRFVHQGDQFVGVFVCMAGEQCLQLLQVVQMHLHKVSHVTRDHV